MSIRRAPPSGVPTNVAKLQKDLADLKNTATAAPIDHLQASSVEGTISFDSLSENEKSAASLGVHPESWKPIGFLNNAHYDTLIKSNALDGDLARRIEVRRAPLSRTASQLAHSPTHPPTPLVPPPLPPPQAYKVVAASSQ